ncbi:MAG: stage III sporulation protein AA [Clostridia bacterium]|nr:stage III sporulation protein AA [Clostridia bacterium]
MFSKYFDEDVAKELISFKSLQEIRVRLGRKLSVTDGTGIHKLSVDVTAEFIDKLFSSLCNYSVYAMQEEIKNGFITLPMGHRAGICGRCVTNDNKILNISEISGINIRIAREIKGCANAFYNIIKEKVENTVIISSPNCGKTTYLRDITRLVSDSGKNVAVADERGEISPYYNGNAVFDLGENTDVLRFCPKNKGMMMVLRTMNPDVIVTDEIGSEEDAFAISEALKCGVKIFTTFHGYDASDFKSRFCGWNNFYYAVILNKRKEVEEILCLK